MYYEKTTLPLANTTFSLSSIKPERLSGTQCLHQNSIGEYLPDSQKADRLHGTMNSKGVRIASSRKSSPINGIESPVDLLKKPGIGSAVYIRYRDHVLYHMSDPVLMSPQTRECLGWLVDQRPDYVTISWDRNFAPPTLKGGDPKAGGLVILRSDILEMRKV